MAVGKLEIKGENSQSLSVVDANRHKLFNLKNDTTLILNNLKIKNAYSEINGAVLNLIEGSVASVNNVEFTTNSVNSGNNNASGGVIYNKGIIKGLTGSFNNNTLQGGYSVIGGAITNETNGIIEDDATGYAINATFIKNNNHGNNRIYGGAIYNLGNIGNIKGIFDGNYNASKFEDTGGGAIYNEGTIRNITGSFKNNYGNSVCSAGGGNDSYGGAIDNDGKIGIITADFSENYTISNRNAWKGTSDSNIAASYGGAISNWKEIEGIEGNFVKNSAQLVDSNNYALGGAISNQGTIGYIKGNFKENYVKANKGKVRGGAIENDGTIGDIEGNFSENSLTSGTSAKGGGISNVAATIRNIKGDFTGNTTTAETFVEGGVIYNLEATIGSITGDFKNNISTANTNALGGEIYNDGTIDNINGDFSGNTLTAQISINGGVIDNWGTIKSITGTISGNTSTAGKSNYGTILLNGGIITELDASFENNISISKTAHTNGLLANDNEATIGNITGDFVGNSLTAETAAVGGGITNSGTIGIVGENGIITGGIQGNFSGNTLTAGTYAYGGGIYNSGTIGNITGNFIDNTLTAGTYIRGGGITNSSTIGNITGDFSNNTLNANTYALGGGIYNRGTIGDIDGNFTNNNVKTTSETQLTFGGAVYSDGTDMTFVANNKTNKFSANTTEDSRGKLNNAIFVRTNRISGGKETFYAPTITLKSINHGNFIVNDTIDGGEINSDYTAIERNHRYNLAVTGDSTGHIVLNNEVQNANATLDNTTLKLGVTDAENHTSDVFATSALTANSGVIDTKDGIYTNYNIKKLDSSDVVRYGIDMVLSKDEQKADTFTLTEGGSGTIYLSSINVTNNAGADEEYTIQIIKTQEGQNAPQLAYDESKVLTNGVQAHMDNQMILGDDFGLATTATTNDSIRIRGLKDVLAEWLEYIPAAGEEKVFDFLDNSGYVLSRDVTALNGDTLTINGSGNTLDINHKNAFSEIGETQKVKISDLTLSNVDTLTNNGTAEFDKVNLETPKLTNNGTLTAKEGTLDTLSLANTGTFNVAGGEVILGASTNDGNITLDTAKLTLNGDLTSTGRGTLNLTKIEPVEISHLIANQDIFSTNSVLNLANVSNFANNSLAMTGGALNLARLGINDNLRFNSITMQGGEINITSVDVDMAAEKMGQISAGSHGDMSGTVNVNNLNILSASDKELIRIKFADDTFAQSVEYHGKDKIETPIYNYAIDYEKDSGEFHFVRGAGGSGNKAEAFNPSVLTAPVAAQAGAYSAINNSLDYAFEHLDAFSLLPSNQRRAALQRQSISAVGKSSGDTAYADGKTGWIKPYAMYESVDLKNGPEPDVTSYGTLIGLDGSLQEMTNGWERVTTLYAGYNGSKISYDDIDTYQNGGVLGITETLYKGNFSTAFTATAGASEGRADTTYGHENFTSLLAGIANKTGYNFEFEEGKYIIQPIMLTSYSFANTLDYTNAAGVKVDSNPLHVFQLHPQVKFIINPDGGWQSYAKAGMVWNLMDKTKFTADDARLPEMSIKPYAEYGIGMQKHWAEKYSAWGEFLGRSGGRDGIAVSAGFRWDFGK